MNEQQRIDNVISEIRENVPYEIVRYYEGFFIIAQNEFDYKSKQTKINNGDIKGFFTLESAEFKFF